jgi:hypothetical protein
MIIVMVFVAGFVALIVSWMIVPVLIMAFFGLIGAVVVQEMTDKTPKVKESGYYEVKRELNLKK